MKLHPPVHLFLSGSSFELGHPNRLGGCHSNATREGLLNKNLGGHKSSLDDSCFGAQATSPWGDLLGSCTPHSWCCCGCSKCEAWVEASHISIANSHVRACHTQGNFELSSLEVP